MFLNDSAGTDGGAAGTTVFARGGTGALADALEAAARTRGVEVRTAPRSSRSARGTAGRAGVTLADGTEIDAKLVVSAADPKRTLRLCDPVELNPYEVWRAENIRQPGSTAKVNLVLSGVPAFHGARRASACRGASSSAHRSTTSSSAMDAHKYGHVAEDPVLEATIPTLVDPSLAPEGTHVMSILFQAAPRHLRDGDWSTERDRVADIAVKSMERFAPWSRRAGRGARGDHA